MRQFTLAFDPSGSGSSDADLILQGLNPAQQEAVRASEGPVLIVAGPGSGKTRTLTYRIAYLLATGKARPDQVLALTFTNKAAREMQERIRKLVGEEQARGIWMGTFHSVFSRILRRECAQIGFTPDFTIYDTDDSHRLLRGLCQRFGVDTNKFTPNTLHALISGAKNALVSPAEYARIAHGPVEEKVAQLYGPYQEMLRRSNAMDFDDLLVRPIELFEQHPETLQKYQQRWKFVHIDEYQDTNRAQYLSARMLAAKHRNLCVVGDDAQSIYAFRGADIQNILSFQRDYPDARVVRLEQNYRSTQRILRLADSIIKQNRDQLDKALWTDNREGDFVTLMEALSEKDEAQKVERTIRDLNLRGGIPYRGFAILYRTNAQSRSLEDQLRRGGIPYRLVGGVSFYQRKEIKDVLAYLRLVVNPNDTASLKRVINYPTRGIGDKSVEQIEQFAAENHLTLWQAIERVEEVGLTRGAANAVEKFRFMIAKYAAQATTRPADELARALTQETGILVELRQENTVESLARWENVQELVSAIAEYAAQWGEAATLSGFLQEVSLATELDKLDEDENRVTLMTLHASKGLEFPVVFITGLEEGLFPLAAAAQDRKELEEERRLFYVGATRAQERLYLLHARSRFRYGQHQSSVRSRFLEEIDPEVIRTETGHQMARNAERFTLRPGSRGAYDEVDPHYYRQDLRRPAASRPKPAGGRGAGAPAPAAQPERRVEYDEGEGGPIRPGLRVMHPTFGQGKVLSLEGQGDQTRAVVFFKEIGQKKLVLKYANLKRIE